MDILNGHGQREGQIANRSCLAASGQDRRDWERYTAAETQKTLLCPRERKEVFAGTTNDLSEGAREQTSLHNRYSISTNRRPVVNGCRSFTPPIDPTPRFHGGGEVSVRPSACNRSRCEPPPPALGRVQAASVFHSWKGSIA